MFRKAAERGDDPAFQDGARWQERHGFRVDRHGLREVEIVRHYPVADRFEVRNIKTGRHTVIRRDVLVKRFRALGV